MGVAQSTERQWSGDENGRFGVWTLVGLGQLVYVKLARGPEGQKH